MTSLIVNDDQHTNYVCTLHTRNTTMPSLPLEACACGLYTYTHYMYIHVYIYVCTMPLKCTHM